MKGHPDEVFLVEGEEFGSLPARPLRAGLFGKTLEDALQIIEYAANASESWASGRARQYAAEFWSRQNKDLDQVLQEHLGEVADVEGFWDEVEANLRNGRIRLIIAADEIRPEVRRMIEYLNREMQNAEVLGLELRCYGKSESSLVLVPRLIGQTQDSIDRRSPGGGAILWSVEELKSVYADMSSEELGQRLLSTLDWALEHNHFLAARAKSPTFALQSKNESRLVSFFSDGIIYVFINEKHFAGGVKERDQFVEELKNLGMLDQTLDPKDVVSGRNLSIRLTEIDDDRLAGLFDVFQRHCD